MYDLLPKRAICSIGIYGCFIKKNFVAPEIVFIHCIQWYLVASHAEAWLPSVSWCLLVSLISPRDTHYN